MAVNNTNSIADIKICSINICGVSERSRIPLDKYVYDEQYDLVAIQETGSVSMEKISLSNMSTITDSNQAINKGVALYVQNKHSITKLEEI
jgi:exonuclease III